MSADPNLFNDESLGFSLRKPDSWEFMPPVWTPGPLAANGDDAPWAWIRPNQAFCVAQKLHESPRHAYSTLQVTARPVDLAAVVHGALDTVRPLAVSKPFEKVGVSGMRTMWRTRA